MNMYLVKATPINSRILTITEIKIHIIPDLIILFQLANNPIKANKLVGKQ